MQNKLTVEGMKIYQYFTIHTVWIPRPPMMMWLMEEQDTIVATIAAVLPQKPCCNFKSEEWLKFCCSSAGNC